MRQARRRGLPVALGVICGASAALLVGLVTGVDVLRHARSLGVVIDFGALKLAEILLEAGAPPVIRDEACCYQELAPLPDFDGNHVVLGAWVVGEEAAGLGIRIERVVVTSNVMRHATRSGRS